MRLSELQELRSFRLIDAPQPPPPGPGEIQVRIRSVGICGSDLHYYADGAIGDTKFQYPVVLGHEPCGEIIAAGAGVTGVSAGARVMVEPAVYCYHCEFCRTGHHNICEHIRFYSTPPDPGFFREVANVPAHNVLPLPDDIDLDTGTLFEPLAVALHSLALAKPQLRETAVVFGGGPIGLCTIVCLRASGAGRIWCIEPRPERAALAKVCGADVVIDPRETDPARQVLADTGKRGADVVFDCATKENTVQQSFDCVRNGGRVAITGIPSDSHTPLNLHVLRRKEAFVINVRRSNHETPLAVELIRARPELREMVTHRMPLEDVGRAFEMLVDGHGGAGKIVVRV